jgi:hypothetical protein
MFHIKQANFARKKIMPLLEQEFPNQASLADAYDVAGNFEMRFGFRFDALSDALDEALLEVASAESLPKGKGNIASPFSYEDLLAQLRSPSTDLSASDVVVLKDGKGVFRA